MGKILIDLSYVRTKPYAGVAKYAYRIIDYIIASGKTDQYAILLDVVSENIIKALYPQLESHTIGSRLVSKIPVFRTLWLMFAFKFFVNRSNYDLIFCPWGNEITCLKVNKKKISVIHDLQLRLDTDGLALKIYKAIDDLVIKNSDRIVTISEFSKKQIKSFYPALQEDELISLGNSVSVLEANGGRVISEPYILYVGRICKMKNVITLVKAFSLIKNKLAKIKLVIVGKKNQYWLDVVEPIIKGEKLDDRIVIIENCSETELTLLYRYATIFVFPSLREGFGSPPIEAAIECTPVISTTCDSLEEVLMGKVYTYNNPMDHEELADKILYVVNNMPLKEELVAIKETYLSSYSINVIGKRVCNYLEEMA